MYIYVFLSVFLFVDISNFINFLFKMYFDYKYFIFIYIIKIYIKDWFLSFKKVKIYFYGIYVCVYYLKRLGEV